MSRELENRMGSQRQVNTAPDRYQDLASSLAASGCSSLLDARFARYLDYCDGDLHQLRGEFFIPTIESMHREAPKAPPPTPPEEVVARQKELKYERASQGGSARLAARKDSMRKERKRSGSQSSSSSGGQALSDGEAASHADAKADIVSGSESLQNTAARDLRNSLEAKAGQQTAQEVAHQQNHAPLDSLFGQPKRTNTGPSHKEHIIYFAGNSLGLQSRLARVVLEDELSIWQEKAVTGWFNHHFDRPWTKYAERCAELLAGYVGSAPSEVAAMGTLTANIHLLMCSFYRPTKDRYKILYEAKAFPSDRYAFASQAEMHGYTAQDALITSKPRKGEYLIRTEDILDTIEKEGDQIAVVFFSGVNFFTGQVFEMEKITKAAQNKGCLVGWDLAHAVGNIPLRMHDWNVDFAAWCTYKYLNSGPGGIGGLFVHEKHSNRPRLAGWWGNNLKTRFEMAEAFDPAPGAAGFQTSTPSILALATLYGSLKTFLLIGKGGGQVSKPPSIEVSLKKLRTKSILMTNYLWTLLTASRYYVKLEDADEFEANQPEHGLRAGFTLITPSNPEHRGAQLSILLLPRNKGMLQPVAHSLMQAGIYGDEREPDVIRFAPVPAYNTYKEVWISVNALEWSLSQSMTKKAK